MSTPTSAAREAARRRDGQFGTWHRDEADIDLLGSVRDHQTISAPSGSETAAMGAFDAIERVQRLHVTGSSGRCASCGVPSPCPTIAVLDEIPPHRQRQIHARGGGYRSTSFRPSPDANETTDHEPALEGARQ